MKAKAFHRALIERVVLACTNQQRQRTSVLRRVPEAPASAADFATTIHQMIEGFGKHDRPRYLRTAQAVASSAQRATLELLERRAVDSTGG
jgi:hypothetical protein